MRITTLQILASSQLLFPIVVASADREDVPKAQVVGRNIDPPVNGEKIPADRVIGRVYDKEITAGDIDLKAPLDPTVKFDAQDTKRWETMSRISAVFGGPILKTFVAEQKIAATPEEIKKFQETLRKQHERDRRQWQAELKNVNTRLEQPGLSAGEQGKLKKQQKMYQNFLKDDLSETPESIATSFIVSWKTERDLHRKYGGRVIFQQFGPEALDARRKLFEEAEKRGELKFNDPAVRQYFYHYSHMSHTVINEEGENPDILEKPWFFQEIELDNPTEK